ncbi:hypothetical protein IMF23_04200 [Chelatococcus daeguensis]|uniref:hypothetical protein n=1 Tax=Chelatococcus daeguensis TaxID=444444 RepID=UPI0012F8F5DA|nr:hypothetical protein [Chelatococcus daeguensis]MBM3082637.1 hypothetical protein [Chelatococcus daeguensis]
MGGSSHQIAAILTAMFRATIISTTDCNRRSHVALLVTFHVASDTVEINRDKSIMTNLLPLGSKIDVVVEDVGEGMYFATSTNMRGLLVAERDRERLVPAVEAAISDLYEVLGHHVRVRQVTRAADEDRLGSFLVEAA